jgi:hypothetical protein
VIATENELLLMEIINIDNMVEKPKGDYYGRKG